MPSIEAVACEKYCIFRRGESRFALPAFLVREITLAENMVPVPGTPKILAGLCHLRSEFVPVLNVPTLCPEDDAPAACGEQLLVLAGAQGRWGIVVDELETLEPLEVSVTADPRGDDTWSATVMGSSSYRDRVVHVLDPSALYRAAENALAEDEFNATP
jgi:chemotaxis signal transduction protein